MFIIAFYWVLFIVLYLSGLFVFVAAHMKEETEEKPTKDESKDEPEEKPAKDESKDEPEEKPAKRVADTPKRALRKVQSEYNLRSRKKNVSKEKPAKD